MKFATVLVATGFAVLSCGGTAVAPVSVDAGDSSVDLGRGEFPEVFPGPDMLELEEEKRETAADIQPGEVHPPDCEPGEGCFEEKCLAHSDCWSGWCVEHLGQKVCTQACHAGCPEGWTCTTVAAGDPGSAQVCVSNYPNLCRPCAELADCAGAAGAQDACVLYGDQGSFCGGSCGKAEECPWGFVCAVVESVEGETLKQCLNGAGVCPCTETSVELGAWTPCKVTNELGTCTGLRVCLADGLTDCDAPEPAAEKCNGLDDDCDGEVDEPDLLEGEYPELCDDGNVCTEDTCLGEEGCRNDSLESGPCDDGNPCTVADHCDQGVCLGDPVECDDGNPCTDNVCAGNDGCDYPPVAGECDDDDPCTVGDVCVAGECHGTPAPCGCQTDEECATLEDGDLCNGTLICDKEELPYVCIVDPATVLDCAGMEGDDAFCLKGHCAPASGECSLVPDHEGFLCDNENICTFGDKCVQGECTGGMDVNCNDGNPCTDDSCAPESGCVHANNDAPCNDGDACTVQDQCAVGQCAGGTKLVCNDGNLCNGVETCNSVTGCEKGESLACVDGNPCTDDSCDEGQGCVFAPNETWCDDGDVCTISDHCQSGECTGGQPLPCDDGDACTDDLCVPALGCQFSFNLSPCDDGLPCTTGDICAAGVCAGQQKDCGDGNPCTDDWCGAGGNCLNEPVEDGGVCGSGPQWQCVAGVCACLPQCDGKECGDDGCEGDCGVCGTGFLCDGAMCQCQPVSCEAAERECGKVNDGCGAFADCGPCPEGPVCTADGKCVDCIALSCDDVCGLCGEVPDGCGGLLDCGDCAGGSACLGGACLACTPRCRRSLLVQHLKQFDELEGAWRIAVSPDGNNTYVTTWGNGILLVFGRRKDSGEMEVKQVFKNHNGVDGLGLVTGVAVSPDGQNVYAVGWTTDSVAVFSRSPVDGELRHRATLDAPGGLVGDMENPTELTVTPDGGHIYVSAANGVAVFARDQTTGDLVFVDRLPFANQEGDTAKIMTVAVSPDGQHVYASVLSEDTALVVFLRGVDGKLTQVQSFGKDDIGVEGLPFRNVLVTPDGKHVYANTWNQLFTFERDSLSGALSLVDALDPTAWTLSGVAFHLVLSPDGMHLYLGISGGMHKELVIFERNPATGALSFLEIYLENVLTEPIRALAFGADGSPLFCITSKSLHLISREPETGHLSLAQSIYGDGTPWWLRVKQSRGLDITGDGRQLYVAARGNYTVSLIERNLSTGQLTFVEAVAEGDVGDALDEVQAVALSPDETHLYAAATTGNAVSAFARNVDTGHLIFLQMLKGASGGFAGGGGPCAVQVSPDGNHVYVSASLGRAVSVFSRDKILGGLTFVDVVGQPEAVFAKPAPAHSLALSPDGANLYVAAYEDHRVRAFERDAQTGALTDIQVVENGVAGIEEFKLPSAVVVSPDGANVYVTASSAVHTFARLPDGTLEPEQILTDEAPGLESLLGAFGLAVAEDGLEVYLTSSGGYVDWTHTKAVTVFGRSPLSGHLALLEVVSTAPAGIPALLSPYAVMPTPGGGQLVVTDYGGVAVIDIERRECGPDGCGGSCGTCPQDGECVSGRCPCQPECEGKECGEDGCGGNCGECAEGVCDGDACMVQSCQTSADCPPATVIHICDMVAGQCVQCLSHAGCQGFAETPHCLLEAARCVECLEDGHCPEDAYCGSSTAAEAYECFEGLVGEPCLSFSQCLPGLYCAVGPEDADNRCQHGFEGDPCVENLDCLPPLVCNGGLSPARCAPPTEEFGPCQDSSDCSSHLQCVGEACRAGREGDPCTVDTHCLNGVCGADKECHTLCGPGCLAELCNPDSGLCVECLTDADCCAAGSFCTVMHECAEGNTCVDDADCAEGLSCLPDGACRLSCGSGEDCPPDEWCAEAGGYCVECLADEQCAQGQYCHISAQQCVPQVCQPATDKLCIGGMARFCLDDGSGYSPALCDPDGCCSSGICKDSKCCLPSCVGNECGDDGCGGSCGECLGALEACVDGQCVCQADCEGKECGPDGCGGECGACPQNHVCLWDGACLCVSDCADKDCGDDGCGGSCGECDCGETCNDSLCEFTACEGVECGPDGCGAVCGECELGQSCSQGVCAPYHIWSEGYGGPGSDVGRSIAADGQGNILVAGTLNGSGIDLGGGPLPTVEGSTDVFVLKLDPSGEHLWSLTFGGEEYDSPAALSVGPSGELTVAGGSESTTLHFGESTGEDLNAGANDVLIVRLAQDGGYEWSRLVGGDSADLARGVDTDGDGNVFVTGYFQSSSIDFGGGPLLNPGNKSMFLAKLDSAGKHLWSKAYGGGTPSLTPYGVAVDGSNNAYVAGQFCSATLDLGGEPLVAVGNCDLFLAKFDAQGNHIWSQGFGGTWNDYAGALEVASDGTAFFSGHFFSPTIDFGGDPLVRTESESFAYTDIFVAAFQSDGGHLWSLNVAGDGSDYAGGIAHDGDGNVYVTGSYVGNWMDFGGGPLENSAVGKHDLFLARFGAGGEYVWARTFGGEYTETGNALVVGTDSSVFLTGQFSSSTVDLGGGPLENPKPGNLQALVARFGQE